MLPNEVVIDSPNSVIFLEKQLTTLMAKGARPSKFQVHVCFKTIKPDSYFEAPAKPQQCTQVVAFKTGFTDLHH